MSLSLATSKQTKSKVPPPGRYLLKEHRCVTFDYNGQAEEFPAIAVTMLPIDSDGDPVEDKEYTQYYKAGSNMENLKPNKAGTNFDNQPGKKAEGLHESSTAAYYLRSVTGTEPLCVVEDGKYFPGDKLDDDVTVLDGIVADMVQVKIERSGLSGGKGKTGGGLTAKAKDDKGAKKDEDFTQTVLLVGEVVKLPGEKGKVKGKPAPEPEEEEDEQPKKKKAAADDDEPEPTPKKKAKAEPEEEPEEEEDENDAEIEASAVKFIKKALAESGEKMTMKELGDAVFKLSKKDPNFKAITKLCYDDEFLGSKANRKNWTFDKDDETVEAL